MTMTAGAAAGAGFANHAAQSSRRDKLRFPPPAADAVAVLPTPLSHHAAAATPPAPALATTWPPANDGAALFTTLPPPTPLQSPAYAGSLRCVVVLMGSRLLGPARELLDEACAALLLPPPPETTLGRAAATIGTSPWPSPSSLSTPRGSIDADAWGWLAADLGREEFREKKAKLFHIQEEVHKMYEYYHQQMEAVVSSFESVPGLTNATPYALLALQAVSRRITRIISRQRQYISRLLGEELLSLPGSSGGGGSAKATMAEKSQQQPAMLMKRPRGQPHPKRAVSVLRAWLLDNFLHPYPTAEDKQMLATRSGLSRNQVSYWFGNARVRLWRPMAEEMIRNRNLDTTLHAGGATGCTASHSGAAIPASDTACALPPPPVDVAMAGGRHQQMMLEEQCLEHAPPPMGTREVGGGGQALGQAGVTTSFLAATPVAGMGGSPTLGLQPQQQF